MGGEGCFQQWRPGLGPQIGWGQGKSCLLSHHLQQAIYLARLNERGRQEGGDSGETSLRNVSLAGHPVLPRARPGSTSSSHLVLLREGGRGAHGNHPHPAPHTHPMKSNKPTAS